MKILFINKRRYTGKDVVDDRYGRMWEIPEHLAHFGHEIAVQTIKYQPQGNITSTQQTSPSGVSWRNFYLWPLPPTSLLSYYKSLENSIRSHRPNVLVASSDAIHAALGAKMARKYEIPLAIDLYDQYEAFGITRFPGLTKAYRNALKQADLVTCVTSRLCEWCTDIGVSKKKVLHLNNAVAENFLTHRDKLQSRVALGLPKDDAILAGTAGALYKSRDIHLLYEAFTALSDHHHNLHLVIAGRRDTSPPKHPRIHDLGIFPHAHIPTLFSALDIGVVCNAQSEFSRFCNPQKLLEMQACGIPVITADVVERQHSEAGLQYKTGSVGSLIGRLEELINQDRTKPEIPKAASWQDRARDLESAMQKITG